MPAPFRVLKPFVTYFTNLGTLNAGGYFLFSETGTEDPKLVYTGPDLVTDNGSQIDIDIAGRAENDAWGSGVYRVRMFDADDDLIADFDNVQAESPADDLLPDPTGHDGEFLVAQGGVYELAEIRQVPDPTGQSGKYLGNDSEEAAWTAFPEAVEYDADNLPGGIVEALLAEGYIDIGNARLQVLTDTAPTASGITTSKAVTFPQPFGSAPKFIGIGTAAQSVTTENTYASASYSAPTTTGCTVHFFAGGENAGAGTTDVNSSIPFTVFAIGEKPAA